MFYADPGSGLLVWQLIVALFLGATFSVSKFKLWIRSKLNTERETREPAEGTNSKQYSSKVE